VHWTRNNLTELTGTSIYRVHQRWHQILRRCAGGRGEGLSHSGVLPWHSLDIGVRLSLVNLHGVKRCGNRLRHGATEGNSGSHGDDHAATSSGKWVQ
jgi:hypothetical protein